MDPIRHEGHNLDEMEAVCMVTVAIEAVVDTQDASESAFLDYSMTLLLLT